MLRRQAQQVGRVKDAGGILRAVSHHALHAVVLQRRARLVQKLVAGDGDFALRVHACGGHAVIGQHQHRAHHKSVRIPGEAVAQVPADGGDAARARAAEDAAGQKHLNRVAPVQIGPHAVHHGVELVGLALSAHVLQRAQQIGKEQYAQIGVPAEALAVFQIGLGAGEQRAGQQPVQRVARGHLADGGGAAAEIHAPPADGQARVKAGVLAGRGRQRGAGLLVGLGGALNTSGVAAGGVHVHREQVQSGQRTLAGRGKSVRARGVDDGFQHLAARSAHGDHIPAHAQASFPDYSRLKKAWRPLMAGGAARRDTAAAASTLSA